MTDETLADPAQPHPHEPAEHEADPKRKRSRSAGKARPIVLTGVASALVALMGAVSIQSLLANSPEVAICVLALLIAFLVSVIAFLQAPKSRTGPALLSFVGVAFIALTFLSFWRLSQDVNIYVETGPPALAAQDISAPLSVAIGPNGQLEDATWSTGVRGTITQNRLYIDASKLDKFYQTQINHSQAAAASSVKNCVQGGGPG